MAMAKAPDDLIKDKEVAVARRSGNHHNVKDTSSPQQRMLRQALSEESWNLYKWVLDICELVARDEHTWKVQRRLILDAIHRHENSQRQLVNGILSLTTEQVMEMAMAGKGQISMESENNNGSTTE